MKYFALFMALSFSLNVLAGPIEEALKLVGSVPDSLQRAIYFKKIVSSVESESFDQARIVITDEGLMDDSVSGVRIFLKASLVNGAWKVNETSRVNVCYRGKIKYKKGPCP